jgi:hypothetical protein
MFITFWFGRDRELGAMKIQALFKGKREGRELPVEATPSL